MTRFACFVSRYVWSCLYIYSQYLYFSYIGGSTTGIDVSAFDTIFCPPTMNMPPEGSSGGIAASGSAELKWAGGGLPHCQLDVSKN